MEDTKNANANANAGAKSKKMNVQITATGSQRVINQTDKVLTEKQTTKAVSSSNKPTNKNDVVSSSEKVDNLTSDSSKNDSSDLRHRLNKMKISDNLIFYSDSKEPNKRSGFQEKRFPTQRSCSPEERFRTNTSVLPDKRFPSK
jgi:hypothetical protein